MIFFKYRNVSSALLTIMIFSIMMACQDRKNQVAPKPLYRDPVHDGAADPSVIWNAQKGVWFMFYTNRRANVAEFEGVSWVHGTRIGIAESANGSEWNYYDTCNIRYRPDPGYTFWAPEIIEHEGTYHMFLTYVPGTFSDWNHPRSIVHLTSRNLMDWEYASTLSLASNKVIDACVLQRPDGSWRMWYNNEKDRKSIYYADSPDLYHWTDKGISVGDQSGEGPKVFEWKGYYWMITDVWRGLAVYRSDDLNHWERLPGNLLEQPGTGPDDGVKGGHPDVVVAGERAWLFYFTHPGRVDSIPDSNWYEKRRSSIQVVELEYRDKIITCDREKPVSIHLGKL
ncbi:MAG: family 43 glycosylhydrolase [Bacteroidales bacterium]|nr:family 43 glycosylhydrolase [Bacteroidales bacterium]